MILAILSTPSLVNHGTIPVENERGTQTRSFFCSTVVFKGVIKGFTCVSHPKNFTCAYQFWFSCVIFTCSIFTGNVTAFSRSQCFFLNPRVSPSAGYMWVPYTDTIVVVVSDVAKATAKAVPALPEEQRVAPLKKLRLGLVAPWEVDGESSHCAVWLKVC